MNLKYVTYNDMTSTIIQRKHDLSNLFDILS